MDIDATLVVVGLTLLVVALLSRVIARVWLSPALVALLVGVAAGPDALDLVDVSAAPGEERALVREVARLTLGVSLVGIGLQMRVEDLRRYGSLVGRLLTVGMVGMWLLTGLGAVVLLGLPLWLGLLLGAVLTPTDPAVATSMVTGALAKNHLPESLRHTLQLESGANDGLALPFVLLAGLALERPLGEALRTWAVEAAQELGIAVVGGAAVGFVIGRLARVDSEHRETGDAELFMSGVALAFLTLGGVHALGGSGILASFVAGLVFSLALSERERERLEGVQQTIVQLAVVPMFVLFGATLPWSGWATLGAPAVAFAVWVLVGRRPPVVPVAMVGSEVQGRGLLWLSWSGPLGVAGIYYASYIERFGSATDAAAVWAAASLAITASVVVHSVAATPLARWYARRSLMGTVRRPLDAGAEQSA